MQFRARRLRFGVDHVGRRISACGLGSPVNCQEEARFRHFSAKRFNNDRCLATGERPSGDCLATGALWTWSRRWVCRYRQLTRQIWSCPSLRELAYLVPVSTQITSTILTSAGMSPGSKWSALGTITALARSL